jgi:hypothetical protein
MPCDNANTSSNSGSTDAYCGRGCQPLYGHCKSSVIPSKVASVQSPEKSVARRNPAIKPSPSSSPKPVSDDGKCGTNKGNCNHSSAISFSIKVSSTPRHSTSASYKTSFSPSTFASVSKSASPSASRSASASGASGACASPVAVHLAYDVLSALHATSFCTKWLSITTVTILSKEMDFYKAMWSRLTESLASQTNIETTSTTTVTTSTPVVSIERSHRLCL